MMVDARSITAGSFLPVSSKSGKRFAASCIFNKCSAWFIKLSGRVSFVFTGFAAVVAFGFSHFIPLPISTAARKIASLAAASMSVFST